MVNFTNLITSGGYIAKSKSQEAYLQLTQILEGDYVIWQKKKKKPTKKNNVT
jgi:hypothetical protein